MAARRRVIEADHCHVVRHPQAAGLQDLQDRGGHQVRGDEDSVQVRHGLEQAPGGLRRAGPGEVGAELDPGPARGLGAGPVGGQPFASTGVMPGPAIVAIRLRPAASRCSTAAEAPAPFSGSTLGTAGPAAPIETTGRPPEPMSEASSGPALTRMAPRCQASAERRQGGQAAKPGHVHRHGQSLPGRLLVRPGEDPGVVRIGGEVPLISDGHGQDDLVSPAARKLARGRVRHPSGSGYRLLDPAPGRVPHRALPGDHPGHGRDRHPCPAQATSVMVGGLARSEGSATITSIEQARRHGPAAVARWRRARRAQQRDGGRDRRQHQAERDPEGQVVAPGQGHRGRAVLGDQRAGPRGGDGGQHGQPERAADLGGGVHQARGQPGVLWGALDMASVIRAGKHRPAPVPISSIDRERCGSGKRRRRPGRSRTGPARPRSARGPGSIGVRAPKRMTSRSV